MTLPAQLREVGTYKRIAPECKFKCFAVSVQCIILSSLVGELAWWLFATGASLSY